MGWLEILACCLCNLFSHAYLACCADWFSGVVLALLSDGMTLYLMLTACVAVLSVGEVVRACGLVCVSFDPVRLLDFV